MTVAEGAGAPLVFGLGEGVASSPARLPFEQFFSQTWPDLVAFLGTLTRQQSLAEELAQEAFARVYARYSLLREPRPYLFRVGSNLVRRTWRDCPTVPYDDLPDAETGAAAASLIETLAAVRALPGPLREVVILHYFADLSVAEVAAQLHRPVGTVKRRLHEARALLMSTLLEDS